MLSNIKDLLYPSKCIGCGVWGRALCDRCLSKIEGFKLYKDMFAFGLYEGVLKELVHSAKYLGYAEPLKELVLAFRSDIEGIKSKVDLIVPVPEDPSRRRIFNHVLYFAKLLGLVLDLGVSVSLYKVRSTPPQVGLGKSDRENNLRGAFSAKESLEGRRVLLVDDVSTTGTTLEECSRVLLESGALEVQRLVVAVNP